LLKGSPKSYLVNVHAELFVVEYGLAQLLQHWGVRPAALLGYSLGEYVAATVAGVLRLEDALRLVVRRAALIERTPGAMEDGLTVQGRLQTEHGFHTPLLRPLGAEFLRLLGEAELRAPVIPYLSSLSGEWVSAEQARDGKYWVEQMCSPVQLRRAATALLEKYPRALLLEVGAGQKLGSFEGPRALLRTLPQRTQPMSEQLLLTQTLGKLWLAGVALNWEHYYEGQRRQRVSLPTYPFERQRFWIEPKKLPL
jgi:acyl transferase domain-containing protein